MSEHLIQLGDAELRGLVAALRAGRLASPFSAVAISRHVGPDASRAVSEDLQRIAESGCSPEQMGAMIELVLEDRAGRGAAQGMVDLVTTGPEASGVTNRDTAVVVREMFTHAEKSVLVVGYAVYQGRRVFQALADRMQAIPALQVRLFLDVQRSRGDVTPVSKLLRQFAERFRNEQWPTDRPVPQVYFDPRSLELEGQKRSSLHAKCVVVDDLDVFVSSANFTEAAQERNIELGLRISSGDLARKINRHFESLRQDGLLKEVC